MKMKLVSFLMISLLLLIITACSGNSTVITRTSASLPPGSPDLVEVDYFYESDACFCLGLASEWIDTTITSDYKNQLDNGMLTYVRYDTKDSANANVMAEFNATNYGFFITVTKSNISSTYSVGGLWLYTDTTGENEMLKSKFIGLLTQELDKALAGE